MIEIKHLYAGYRGCAVLSDINMILPTGKITVIAGPNGCGKSTLLKTVCGIISPLAGGIYIDGEDISSISGNKLSRKVSYLAQSRQIPDISVQRMVLHGRFPYLSYPRRYRSEDIKIADRCMEVMGIADIKEQPLSTLSGGTRQKVYIAMALAQDTQTVLLDEPTTFLDISHQFQTLEHARYLAEKGKTVVMVLHDLPMAMATADHLVIMDRGTVLQSGTPDAVFDSGCLERVFHVQLHRFQTASGWQYYYERG